MSPYIASKCKGVGEVGTFALSVIYLDFTIARKFHLQVIQLLF